ncbi:MAG: hypothetical protein GKR91_15835 [Pseudomonadales bacterium]|nr:hypothetical protein [Pseudomonadales bacterium]
MKSIKLLPLSLGLGLLVSAQVFSQEQDTLDYREGYGLVLEQQWNDAQAHFIEFQSDWPESAWVDDAAFWNCYAIEQSEGGTDQTEHFNCYQNFVQNYPNSTWIADARSKLAVLGSRLSDLGYPQYISGILNDSGFDFDFDTAEFEETIREAMELAEEEMERLREQGYDVPAIIPPIPPVADLIVIPDFDEDDFVFNFDEEQIEEMRENAERMRRNFDRVRVEVDNTRREVRRIRNSGDDELLTIIGALRDDERVSEVLIQRLETSENPEFRTRIVLLLEDLPGENITSTLTDIAANDEAEGVRNAAILVLLDRDEPESREMLLEIATDQDYPVSVRSEILDEMEDWNPDVVLPILSSVLRNETNPILVSDAADTLSDMETAEALNILTSAYESIDNVELQHQILEEIADVDLPNVIGFLTDVALTANDDVSAAVAIEGIADREDNMSVAALENIYANTENLQRRLAVIEGIGDAETEQSVVILSQIIADSDTPEITASAVRALGGTDLESAVAPVVNAYQSNDEDAVRRSAIRALRRLDEFPAANDALLDILEERLNEAGN